MTHSGPGKGEQSGLPPSCVASLQEKEFPPPCEQASTPQSAEDQDNIDLIREFYLARLSQTLPETSIRPRHRTGSSSSSRASTPPKCQEKQGSPPEGAIFTSGMDQELLTQVGEINIQLEQYYNNVNQSGTSEALTSEDPLSCLYLDAADNRWPKPTELLGLQDYPAHMREALYALDRRDELCRKIISVQHCSLLAMCTSDPRSSAGVTESISRTRETAQSAQESSEDTEVRRLRRMVELYKTELARLYEA